MKKSFVLFLAILVVGAVVVYFGQSNLLAEKDNVKITENILYGDKSVVEGVTLELHNHYETQVFWDTTYVIGEKPKTNTEYTFHQAKQNINFIEWDGNIYFNDDMHSMGWDAEKNPLAPDGLEVAVQELKDSIGASEKKTKKVSDFFSTPLYYSCLKFLKPAKAEAERVNHSVEVLFANDFALVLTVVETERTKHAVRYAEGYLKML